MPAYLGGSDQIGLSGWPATSKTMRKDCYIWRHDHERCRDGPAHRAARRRLDHRDADPGVSGVTMRHVPGDLKHLAIVGCGLQGSRHLEVALTEKPG